MNEAKVRLSEKEAELVQNTDWILTKNVILKKAWALLETVQQEQKQYLQSSKHNLPEEILKTSAKISKGENYKELPYLVLDFPRFFVQENIFAIRTMFWWGNHFSITLHLSGNCKKIFEEKILASFPLLKEFSLCVNNDPWEHHFEKSNYQFVRELGMADYENLVREKSFIKLAKKIPLEKWDDAPSILFSYFKEIIVVLAN
jgi:hypothetical protein